MTEGISGTSYEFYQRPDPLEDEPEPHSWDSEIDRLHAQDQGEAALQRELDRADSGLSVWELPREEYDWLVALLQRFTYRDAVAHFLAQRAAEAHVDGLMADFEDRLEGHE